MYCQRSIGVVLGSSGAKNTGGGGGLAFQGEDDPPELFEFLQAWPALGSALRQAVLAVVRTVVPERRQNHSGGAT